MTTFTHCPQRPARATRSSSRRPGVRGVREIAVLAVLWVFSSLSRLVAADDLVSARHRAADILHVERWAHLDIEAWLNHALAQTDAIAVPMSFWYATLHYLVTPATLAFVYFRHRADYARARNAIVIGSAIGLACYLLLPTAPPRLMPGSHYLDALSRTASFGWWGGDASAPAGVVPAWATSPTSWPRCRRCTSAGRSGWRGRSGVTPTSPAAPWPSPTSPAPRWS
jgi:hypothetical protein